MTVELKVLDYDVRYDEDENLWKCWDLKLQASSLAALRQKINAHDADTRRVDKFPALLAQWRGSSLERVSITLIVDTEECWVLTDKGRRRQKVKYADLFPITDESKAAIEEWKRAAAAAKKAEQEAEAAMAKIPRVTRGMRVEAKVAKAEDES